MFRENKEALECLFEAVTGITNAQQSLQEDQQPKNTLDKDVSDFLLNDLESKIIEILQESKKTMRHSKRHILTT
jgi:hypothetical protein